MTRKLLFGTFVVVTVLALLMGCGPGSSCGKGGDGSGSDKTPGGVTVNFTGTPLSGTAPLTVKFTDLSTPSGQVTAWSWNFGDTGTSTQQNPSRQYTANGNFTVSLTITDATGSATKTKPGYITVGSGGGGGGGDPPPGGEKGQLFQEINALRAAAGVPALVYDSGIARVAQSYAEYCAPRRQYSPTLSGTPASRLRAGGVSFSRCDETGCHYDMLPLFPPLSNLDSAKLTNPAFRRVGIGYAVCHYS